MYGERTRVYSFRHPGDGDDDENRSGAGPNPYRKLKWMIGLVVGLYLLDLMLTGPRQGLESMMNMAITVPILIVSLSFHEFAHAWMANFLGDDTAKRMGRLSLNPMAHLDLFGTLLLFFAGFGWAKPVPVDPRNFRVPDRAMMVVSLAGPASNLFLAFLAGFGLRLMVFSSPGPSLVQLIRGTTLGTALWYMLTINLALAVFNLIPLPPLDGSKILTFFLSARQRMRFRSIEQMGPFLLIILVSFGAISMVMTPVIEYGRVLILQLFFTVW